MLYRCLIALAFLFAVTSAFAEEPAAPPSAAPNANPPQVAPAQVAPAQAGPVQVAPTQTASAQVAIGDHWTYELKDEISGELKTTRTDIVTDVSNDQITVRFDVAGTNRTGIMIYDHFWNVLHDGPFKYSPNDGTGFRLPLTVGAQWKFAIDVLNAGNGQTFRRTGNSRVTGQESISTKAGSFNTFVVETNFTGKNVQDPSLVNQTSWRTWFCPDVNHWIKRAMVFRQRGNLVQNNTIELTEYGHK